MLPAASDGSTTLSPAMASMLRLAFGGTVSTTPLSLALAGLPAASLAVATTL